MTRPIHLPAPRRQPTQPLQATSVMDRNAAEQQPEDARAIIN